MNADLGMIGQEVLDELGFMGREIVGDDVDLAAEGLGSTTWVRSQRTQCWYGVARSWQGFRRCGYPGPRQRKGAVAVILKAMSLGSARRKRQDRIQAVQGLDGRLFVYAKDGGMIRRVQIEADNVGGLLLEVGILAEHVTAQPVRLKAMPSPHPRNGHVIGAKHSGQPATAPVVVPS